METVFYKRNSGASQVEELLGSARYQAESFHKVLNEYSLFHLVTERLKELEPQLKEQTKVVDALRLELAKAEEQDVQKRRKDTTGVLRSEYTRERDALNELKRSVTILRNMENQPETPAWLKAFLVDVMS